MVSLAFVHQEAFGHPEIEEVMQEVFTGDCMGSGCDRMEEVLESVDRLLQEGE